MSNRVGDLNFQKEYSHMVRIVSADKPKDGRKGIIYITMLGKDNSFGDEHKLYVKKFPRKFKRGHINKFTIKDKFSSVVGIEIRGDKAIGDEGWNIDKIIISEKGVSEILIPVFSNITSDSRATFLECDVCLPQNDNEELQAQRRRELLRKQQLYALSPNKLVSGLPALSDLPPEENFSFTYEFKIGIKFAGLESAAKIRTLVRSHITCKGEFKSIADIRSVFHGPLPWNPFKEPKNLERWRYDEAFGMQRLAGVNCSTIELCTEVPIKIGFTKHDEEITEERIGMTLKDAVRQKRLFMVDYEILKGLCGKPDFVVPAPIALFFQEANGKLLPIAIQLQQEPSDTNPVFLPSDHEFTWIFAKMWFNVADSCYHQAIAHLGFTHLKMEGIAVVTNRQLHRTHPIFKLLSPHFIYLLAINQNVTPVLLEKDSRGDKLLATGGNGMKELIQRKNKVWRLDVDGSLPEDLERRGVADPEILPHYYYRKDAMPLYQAIHKYVTSYVKLYYETHDEVITDDELQAWRREIIDSVEEGGLGMLGVPGEHNKFTKREQVFKTLTSIIFTCSVQHAAVNFRQYEEYAFPPNRPGMLKGPLPTSKAELLESDLVESLPDINTTYSIMALTAVLSTKGMNKLGDFEVNYITDKKALKVVKEFKDDLKRIAKEHDEELKGRLSNYECLNPDEVPNSTSI